MFSKLVINGMREEFHEKFGELSEQSVYLKKATYNIFALIGGSTAPKELRNDMEDALAGVVASASEIGYYIGLSDGADAIKLLTEPNFAEELLRATGDLKEQGGETTHG